MNDNNTGEITFGTVSGISLGGQHKVTLKKSGFMDFNLNIIMQASGLSYNVDLAPGEGEFWPDPVEDANIKVLGKLTITADYFGDWKCVGELRNYGGRWADFIEIMFSFYDSEGNIIDTDFTFCDGKCGTMNTGLKPGQKGTFNLWTNVKYNQVARYEYNITWVTRGYGLTSQNIQYYNFWLITKSQRNN